VRRRRAALVLALAVGGALAAPALALAQVDVPDVAAPAGVTIQLPNLENPEEVAPAMKLLLVFTVLSLAPGILISMTSFTRIVIVLSFVRQALGTQSVPPRQIVMALSLLMTGVIMAPVIGRIEQEALTPYENEEISFSEATERGAQVMREFLLPQTREADLLLFYDLTETDRPDEASAVALHLLVPAFMLSELRTGFEMGFLLFLPFVLIDMITGSVLTSMGMVMLPPTMISTPLKLLMFVLVDGWGLLTRALIASFT
jgi:flagellar biosynthetic protein FliP